MKNAFKYICLVEYFKENKEKWGEMFSKEEICHIKMIALLLFHFFFSGKPWTIFTSAWLNISKKTRKNEGISFQKKKYLLQRWLVCCILWKPHLINAIHKTQNGHLKTLQNITVFIRARQIKLSIDGKVQWNLDLVTNPKKS